MSEIVHPWTMDLLEHDEAWRFPLDITDPPVDVTDPLVDVTDPSSTPRSV